MNRLDDIMMIARQRNAELLKEAEHERLVNEAFKVKTPKVSRIARIMAYVGKELTSAGHSLELRFSGQSEPHTTLNPQINPGGCS